jgi:hypothetical protein
MFLKYKSKQSFIIKKNIMTETKPNLHYSTSHHFQHGPVAFLPTDNQQLLKSPRQDQLPPRCILLDLEIDQWNLPNNVTPVSLETTEFHHLHL